MPRLTETKAKTAPLPKGGDRQSFTWCSAVRGFGVRVTNNGARSYIVQSRINGKPVRKTLGPVGVLAWEGPPDAPGALDLAKLAIAAARRGKEMDTTIGRAKGFTLGQVWEAYVAAGFPVQGTAAATGKLKQPSTIENDRARWRVHISKKLANKPVGSLTSPVVERWRDGLKGTARDTALLLLHALLGFAKSRGLCEVPTVTVKAGRSRKVQNYLTPEEMRRFDAACVELAALQPHRAIGFHATRVVLRTGSRKSEMLSLRRDLTDLDARTARLLRDKGNPDGRIVHLSDDVVEILRSLPVIARSPYFFPGFKTGAHFTDITNQVAEALKHAGLKRIRPHDLRHSFASAALNNGVSLSEVGKLLGHKDWNSTQRYAHLADDAVRRAADKVADVF